LLIEEKVDITHLIEDGWDLRRYYNWKRYAWGYRLKYGSGLARIGRNNSQLKLYGSGALEA
jgi:hypothetical protein